MMYYRSLHRAEIIDLIISAQGKRIQVLKYVTAADGLHYRYVGMGPMTYFFLMRLNNAQIIIGLMRTCDPRAPDAPRVLTFQHLHSICTQTF